MTGSHHDHDVGYVSLSKTPEKTSLKMGMLSFFDKLHSFDLNISLPEFRPKFKYKFRKAGINSTNIHSWNRRKSQDNVLRNRGVDPGFLMDSLTMVLELKWLMPQLFSVDTKLELSEMSEAFLA